ncbi:UDP-4-amino-4-deoxy-L-arabinose--oxoglutarate aminotransferase [Streptomyces sp. YIM 130001]|uniref:DegT/DnrJ/EryC1/StrS family aminotransferase n=1 Tax=Streptomyces sp. YIM 130001 TaxID=2259644 RepID=UPI000E65756D|nr:DegT/DnrJ/EryC1/StrS family aminotransferase [Streptomyces sp. YIM 130001]RII07989.1 UDP-4-amino-4-deoxy-L-arabinose--oxoglutarate aminotransferase [Streptomyces sp. YIM 130001]
MIPSPTAAGIARNASPYLHGGEETALCQALRSGQYGHSELTDTFEHRVARLLGVEDAVAVASGTAALHLALLAAGAEPGTEVVVPSFTYCATVQAIVATGAHPRFIDVDPDTGCIDDQHVLEALTGNTRIVLPVLYGGRPVDLTAASPVLAARGITVVEDAAHAFGSRHPSRVRVGATGDLTCFSFGPIKNLTCGQGGMIVPRTRTEATTLRRLRGLGVVQSPTRRAEMTSYTVDGFGMRAQMPSLNAAIGLAQLPHLHKIETRRRSLWRTYADALRTVDGITLVDVDIDHALPHLCAVRVDSDRRDPVFSRLRGRGIAIGTHYPPNHLQPAFRRWHRALPSTEQLGRKILTLPFHPHLTEQDIDHVTTELAHALEATR